MDVMGYTVLQEESLPTFLKGRPQMTMCLACAGGLLLVTALSITIGIFIGYTYCYIEHKSGFMKANITRTNVKLIPMHGSEYQDNESRPINDAFVNNFFVSKLLRVSGLREDPTISLVQAKEIKCRKVTGDTWVPEMTEESVPKETEESGVKVPGGTKTPKIPDGLLDTMCKI